MKKLFFIHIRFGMSNNHKIPKWNSLLKKFNIMLITKKTKQKM